MNTAFQRLLTAISHPESILNLGENEWDQLLRHSRDAGLLSRLSLISQQNGWETALPQRVRNHMRGATFIADRQVRAVRWEVHKVNEALEHLDIPIVLLKGAAYVMASLPPAEGRLFGDIDFLVPRTHLDAVEMQLLFHGWHGKATTPYDQRYYREWMHEIPPLTHVSRGSTLDVHHNILPLTAKLKPQAKTLFEEIKPIQGYSKLYRLGDADLVLHSATHLFHEGEWGHGLRDLVDLDALLRHFGNDPDFWKNLQIRAHALGLTQPLEYALFFTKKLLHTPINDAQLNEHIINQPPAAFLSSMLMRGFSSAHTDMMDPGSTFALWLLYIRSHWLRMPLHQLVPHLYQKARMRLEDRKN